MARRKKVESLKQQCYIIIAKDVHKIAVDIEESPSPSYMEKRTLNQIALGIPHSIVEQIILKVIESIHENVQRCRRTIGLITCLDVLLQPHLHHLDLSGLFFKMRLPSSFNAMLRETLKVKVIEMKHLTSLSLISKCDDDILEAISKYCPKILTIKISYSDLVTDKGMHSISKGCLYLEKLEIYKCWAISVVGIRDVLSSPNNLKHLQCDELGKVFLIALRNTQKKFKLIHFEQTLTSFEPSEEEVQFLAKICPNMESVRLYTEDEFLSCLPKLGILITLELEMLSNLGSTFSSIVPQLVMLKTIQISCTSIGKQQISLIGKHCEMLSTLHITTATIDDDDKIRNNGNLYQNLKLLHFQIWKETSISMSLVNFFLIPCRGLVSVYIKAKMDFFNDNFLKTIIAINPLHSLRKLSIGSDKYVPLTIDSAYYLLDKCRNIENLSVSSWQLAEEEFTSLNLFLKLNNYVCSIS